MEKSDIYYLCTLIGDLSGIPVRVYENGERVFYHSPVRLPKDPVGAYEDGVKAVKENVGYYATDRFQYYGVVNSNGIRIVLGPSAQTAPGESELCELAFRADVLPEDRDDFVAGMKAVACVPLEIILQILCTLNCVLNGEKKTLEDIAIYDREQEALSEETRRTAAAARFSVAEEQRANNTYDIEQRIMDLVRKGDTEALREWASSAPAVRGGVFAPDQLRQMKNTFIVTATLASRAAIRGGMDPGDAFSYSDSYIKKCELLSDPDRITNLQYHMILEFTERVKTLRIGDRPTKLTSDVSNYVRRHLSEPVRAEDIAKELYMSRPYLSKRFKEESGMTLTDFILSEKTKEAKRLLRYTDKPLSAIAAYLGFSSQSHMSRVFRRYAGSNPGEYREKYIK